MLGHNGQRVLQGCPETMPLSYIGSRSRSFGCALRGIATLVRTQPNARIHLLAAIAVVIAGIWCRLSLVEWALITIAIAGVLVSEALNTAVELVVDLASPELHPLARQAKDVAAGGVLLAAMASVAIGIFVFGPRLARIFYS